MGASSFSPSPMTTTPSTAPPPSTTRMASTAAPSAPSLSPRPMNRAAAMAAASVTRTSSIARVRSGAVPSPEEVIKGPYRLYAALVLLAELEVRHSRPIAPTRRLALGSLYLPTDPLPGFGGLLLAGLVGAFSHE